MTYTNIINQKLAVEFDKSRLENYLKNQGVKQLNFPEE
jgi:hypothetical protein